MTSAIRAGFKPIARGLPRPGAGSCGHRALQQIQPELHWIFAGGVREFIDERLNHPRDAIRPGARSAPVLRPSGMVEVCTSRFSTYPAGNSPGLNPPSFTKTFAFAIGDKMVLPRYELSAAIHRGFKILKPAAPIVVMAEYRPRGSTTI